LKFFDHLLILTERFPIGIETETTVAQISQLLNCSERHVKTILHYLEAEGYIKWEVYKGRGKRPRIMLVFSKEDLFLQEAKRNIREEKYQEAFRTALTLGEPVREDFQSWFLTHLGLLQKDTAEQELDVLRYPFYETNLIMDPLYVRSRHDSHMVKQIFDRLVEYDPITNQLIPRIAQSWESIDGKRWTFYLQKGIRFHHGRELTAYDVEATFNRLLSEDFLLKNIESIKVINKTVIQFQLCNTDYLFPRYLSSMKTSIVPLDVLNEDETNFRKFPIGSGPYKLTRHDEEMVQLEVFENYFERRPWLDRIEIIKTPAIFKWGVGHPFLLSAPDETWKQVRIIEEGASFLTFNCQKDGPMRDRHNREQLFKTINPKEFSEKGHDKKLAFSFLSTQSEKYHLAEIENQPVINLQEEPLKIAAQQIRDGVNHEREALLLQKQLIRAGIHATVELVDVQLFENPETYLLYDIFVGGIALSEDKLLSILTTLQSKKLMLYRSFSDEMRDFVDQQIALIKELQEDSHRWEIYFKIEEHLKSNYAICFLNHRFHTVYKPDRSTYQNVELDSNGRVDYRKVWKKESNYL
jgi:SgrR family transcriptional regulator